MNLCLFLDDERNPQDVTWIDYPPNTNFYVVRDLQSFIEKLAELEPEYISFDHDLGVDENEKVRPTGYDCVKCAISFLLYNDEHPIPQAIFHSKNPVGSKNMRLYWKNGVREVREIRGLES